MGFCTSADTHPPSRRRVVVVVVLIARVQGSEARAIGARVKTNCGFRDEGMKGLGFGV